MQTLSVREMERYDRQIRISELGVDGQLKLKNSRVLVVGVGGLGGVAATYLAAAGVGHLRIVDGEVLELNNLNRQIPYSEKDVGRPKAEALAERLRLLNSDIVIEAIPKKITTDNVDELMRGVDVVVDGLDSFEARFLVNDKCVEFGVPFVHGAVYSFEGRLMTIVPGKSPCLRCFLSSAPPELEVIPVVGPVPGVVGCLEALEAIKIITGVGELFTGKMLIFDGLSFEFMMIPIHRSPDCPVCSNLSK